MNEDDTPAVFSPLEPVVAQRHHDIRRKKMIVNEYFCFLFALRFLTIFLESPRLLVVVSFLFCVPAFFFSSKEKERRRKKKRKWHGTEQRSEQGREGGQPAAAPHAATTSGHTASQNRPWATAQQHEKCQNTTVGALASRRSTGGGGAFSHSCGTAAGACALVSLPPAVFCYCCFLSVVLMFLFFLVPFLFCLF